MRFSTPKYCKTIVCLIVFLSIAVGGYAQNSNAMQKAVFDGISLRDFSGATGEICNRLLLHNSGRTTIIFIQPTKLQLHPYSNIHSYNIKRQNVPVCTQFALNIPTISNAVRERMLATESQQKDLDSSFVDDGKEHIRDGEKIKNASMLLLSGFLYFTLATLIGDNDDNGVYDLFEQEKSLRKQ